MPMEKSEKIKFYIVLGLALIFIVAAYFRFWHKKGNSAMQSIVAESPAAPLGAPLTEIDKRADEAVDNRYTQLSPATVKRDIFRPVRLPAVPASGTDGQKSAGSQPNPKFILGGTIIGGGAPIAVINDRFVRQGDSIDEYRVVHIGKNEVRLVSRNHKIVLKLINNE
jgi:hypothetical protein